VAGSHKDAALLWICEKIGSARSHDCGHSICSNRPADHHENADAPSDPRRVSVKQAVTVLLVGAVLACIHREISGASDGSLVSIITGYGGGTLHHLGSILFNRGS
jgi:hypothetical protein